MRNLSTLIIVGAAFVGIIHGAFAPIIDVGYAQYRGNNEEKWDLDVYKGIRYAKSPELFWKPEEPEEVDGTPRVIDAIKQPPMCFQTGIRRPKDIFWGSGRPQEPEQKDCLFLNVYTPASRGEELLPVLVWIHGGDFQNGRADADPRVFMKTNNNGFIFVDIQYRLSVFGFLKVSYYHAHEDAVTNVGLFDQRMALEWVQKHIHKFGGDKNRVTLGGHQAGATSAIFQALANNGEDAGLFKNIIAATPFMPPVHAYDKRKDKAMSDSSRNSNKHKADAMRRAEGIPKDYDPFWAKRPCVDRKATTIPEKAFKKFLQLADCSSLEKRRDGEYACLRKTPRVHLHHAAEVLTRDCGHFGRLLFTPSMEADSIVAQVNKVGRHYGLLRHWPSAQLKNGTIAGRNILVGTSVNDGLPLAMEDRLSHQTSFNQWFGGHFHHPHHLGLDSMDMEERSTIKMMYGPESNGSFVEYNNTLALDKDSPKLVGKRSCGSRKWHKEQRIPNAIVREAFHHCPAEWAAQAFTGGEKKAWRYEYAHDPNLNKTDLAAVFPNHLEFDPKDGRFKPNLGIMYALQKMWGSFVMNDSPVIKASEARFENPNAEVPVSSDDEDGLLKWPAYTEAGPWMLVLDSAGSKPVMVEMRKKEDYQCPVNRGNLTNHFSLGNSMTWNDNRGARCEWWRNHAYRIPM